MKYFKKYKGDETIEEISKELARITLDGWWLKESLDDIFDNDREFRLYTPFAEVWTQDDDGAVPIAGFYGIVGMNQKGEQK